MKEQPFNPYLLVPGSKIRQRVPGHRLWQSFPIFRPQCQAAIFGWSTFSIQDQSQIQTLSQRTQCSLLDRWQHSSSGSQERLCSNPQCEARIYTIGFPAHPSIPRLSSQFRTAAVHSSRWIFQGPELGEPNHKESSSLASAIKYICDLGKSFTSSHLYFSSAKCGT